MKKILLFIVVMTTSWTLHAQSLMLADFEGNATDNWCDNHITEETDGAKIIIADNPKKTERNNSDKVLKIYEVRKGGMIDFNLASYWTGSVAPLPEVDRLYLTETDGTPKYTRLKLKYYIEGNNVASSKLDGIKIQLLENPEKSPKNIKSWGHPFETQNGTWNDWNEVTFEFEVDVKSDRILLFSYIDWTTIPITGVTIYIDDVEFFKPEIPAAEPSLMIGNFERKTERSLIRNRITGAKTVTVNLSAITHRVIKAVIRA